MLRGIIDRTAGALVVAADVDGAPTSWDEVSGRRYLPPGRILHPGVAWVPPGDFNPNC
ncbi:hypothetical protein GPZ80_31460 [Actinokineospora sp. HBU206404]|uniref:Uncharacterized protein n=2 Tax=Actinokineospora xionganensis TaxID=2684470 RepID=A0ABR7LH19_9PSEU|nr:hypothetical protein [Actinokineospora xionganensis]